MIPTQRLPASLTPLEVALAAVLDRLEPAAPIALSLVDAIGCVAADMPPLNAFPPADIAVSDGWALRARDLVGASSYSPLPLARPPIWVEAGNAMPEGCDCVIDFDLVDQTGPMVQVLAEAIPGQGVRRIGGDIAGGVRHCRRAARSPARSFGRPRGGSGKNERAQSTLRPVNIPPASGHAATAQLISENARAEGRIVLDRGQRARCRIDRDGARYRIVRCGGHIGGSGVGRSDAAIASLARRGEVLAHGIALQPGRTSAVGRIGKIPVIALPGAPDQALAAWCARTARAGPAFPAAAPAAGDLPLARKIASSVGIAEVVLLERNNGAWMPLSVGEMPLETIARADGCLAVPGSSEGFAAGTPVDAYILRD